MLKDLTYAARLLLRSKGWTAMVVLSLALGTGANTALFSAVNGLALRTLAVEDPESLVRLLHVGRNEMVTTSSDYGTVAQQGGVQARATMSFPMFEQLRKDNQTMIDMFAGAPMSSVNVVIDGQAEIASSGLGPMAFEIRTAGDPTQSVAAIRETVRQVDPNLPLMNVSTQLEQIEARFAQERVFAQAYALFGGLALLVASIGLFGLMSYSVTRRTNEIGVRMALGAERRDVVRMVMGESLILVVVGLAIGLAGALAAGRLIASLLFGLSPTDTPTIALAALVMTVVSAFAGYLPARRAASIDPMIALRYE